MLHRPNHECRQQTEWARRGDAAEPDAPQFLERFKRDREFAEVTGRIADSFKWPTIGRKPERIPGRYVPSSFFTVLGVEPILGRTFVPEEDVRNPDPAVVISHNY